MRVQAVFGLKDQGFNTIMVNCNPETVSTDFDLADRLYFEPVTFEDVLNIIEFEKPDGVLVQFGGQTPLKIANALQNAGVEIVGTSPENIDNAEDREKFGSIIKLLDITCPQYGTGRTIEEVVDIAEKLGTQSLQDQACFRWQSNGNSLFKKATHRLYFKISGCYSRASNTY